jgi:hypothetical protein
MLNSINTDIPVSVAVGLIRHHAFEHSKAIGHFDKSDWKDSVVASVGSISFTAVETVPYPLMAQPLET